MSARRQTPWIVVCAVDQVLRCDRCEATLPLADLIGPVAAFVLKSDSFQRDHAHCRDRSIHIGERAKLVGDHPWSGFTALVIVYERYGYAMKSEGYKLRFDDGRECYARRDQLRPVKEKK